VLVCFKVVTLTVIYLAKVRSFIVLSEKERSSLAQGAMRRLTWSDEMFQTCHLKVGCGFKVGTHDCHVCIVLSFWKYTESYLCIEAKQSRSGFEPTTVCHVSLLVNADATFVKERAKSVLDWRSRRAKKTTAETETTAEAEVPAKAETLDAALDWIRRSLSQNPGGIPKATAVAESQVGYRRPLRRIQVGFRRPLL